MKKIIVKNNGKDLISFVSDVDYQFISNNNWSIARGYAKNSKLGSMHRTIMKLMLTKDIPKEMQVDHINRNKLDNQRENLRLATHSENAANAGGKKNKEGYRGIKAHRRKWQAEIQKDKRKIFIGLYSTKEAAAIAYNIKAKELFGDFAYQNTL